MTIFLQIKTMEERSVSSLVAILIIYSLSIELGNYCSALNKDMFYKRLNL